VTTTKSEVSEWNSALPGQTMIRFGVPSNDRGALTTQRYTPEMPTHSSLSHRWVPGTVDSAGNQAF